MAAQQKDTIKSLRVEVLGYFQQLWKRKPSNLNVKASNVARAILEDYANYALSLALDIKVHYPNNTTSYDDYRNLADKLIVLNGSLKAKYTTEKQALLMVRQMLFYAYIDNGTPFGGIDTHLLPYINRP